MELLPCPFCGSSDIAFKEGSTFRWIEAMCQNCGATCGETRATTLGGPDEEMDKRLAATEWNRRASPASVPGWKLVPDVPTSTMVLAGEKALSEHDFLRMDSAYCAMLATAPTPPVSEDKDKIIAAANALENIASTSSSTRIRRVANAALTAIRARRK